MLETFTLKQSLDTTRQELSQALYQHDAACRVIARLMRERDEARAQLASLEASGYAAGNQSRGGANNDHMDVSESSTEGVSVETPGPLDADILSVIDAKHKELMVARKGRKAPDSLATKEHISQLSSKTSYTPHKSDKKEVTSIAVRGTTILTGGADKDAILSDSESGRVISKLVGHSKKVNAVAFHPSEDSNIVFTASADKTVKV
jgi:pre-mRNA-processing factor 19